MLTTWILLLIIFILIPRDGKFYYYVRWLYFIMLCLLTTTVASPYFIFRKKHPQNLWLCSYLSDIIFWFLDIKFELRCTDKCKMGGRGIIVVNHQSSIDSLCIAQVYRHYGDCVGVAKKEIKYFGSFGLVLAMGGYVFIDRQNRESAIKLLSEGISNHLKHYEEGKVIIFPEGTRNTIGNEFLPFKKGAFRAAIDNQVPIFPCVISPLNFIKKKQYFNTGKIIVTMLEPIPTVGMTAEGTNSLIEKTRNVMAEEYRKLGKELFNKKIFITT